MRPRDHNQIEIMAQVVEFKKECATQGLRIDDGQAWECLISSDPARVARRFHNRNIQCEKSCGAIHFSNGPDEYFDLPAPAPTDDDDDHDPFLKIHEIMGMRPKQHRELVAMVLLEMKRPGGSASINSAVQALGLPRSNFYKILFKIRRWAMRPPTPEGWSSCDCASLVQLSLDFDFGGGK